MGKFEHGNLLVSLSEGHRHGYSLAAVVVGLGIGAAGLCKALHRSLVIPWVSWKFFSESERVCYAGGLKNLGNNSFLNVILQALASCDHFVSSLDDLLGSDGVLPEEQPERMPLISGLSSLLKGTQASLKLIVRRGDSGRLKRQIKGNLLMTVAHICVGLQLLFYWIPRMNSVSCCVSCITSISKVEAILYSFESPAPGGKVKPESDDEDDNNCETTQVSEQDQQSNSMNKQARPGMKEYQLESIFLYQAYMYGACRHCSYTCIRVTVENRLVSIVASTGPACRIINPSQVQFRN